MVTRKTSQLCQRGKGKEMWSSCGFRAFHSGPELNVCVEIDNHQSYLFSTICSGHVYCLASSSTMGADRGLVHALPLDRHPQLQDPHRTWCQLSLLWDFLGCLKLNAHSQDNWDRSACLIALSPWVSPPSVAGVDRSPVEGPSAKRDSTRETSHRQGHVAWLRSSPSIST